jgi:hypothetical protein
VIAPIDRLQKRLCAPPPPKPPLCPLFPSTDARVDIDIRIRIRISRRSRRTRKRWLRQDVIGELDDASPERVALILPRAGSGRRGRRGAQVRGVFFAYDGIVRKGVREDGVDDRLRGIVGHLSKLKRESGARCTCVGMPCGRWTAGSIPVTGLLSPLTSVSPATSLLKTVVVSAHARRTAAMATCCSRANGTGIGERDRCAERKIIRRLGYFLSCG